MKNKKLLSRAMSIALTLLMTMSLVLVYAPEANAASSGKLIKTVVRYYREPGSKWQKMEKLEYTYNSHKDPTKIVDSFKGAMKSTTLDCIDTYRREYTYKNGKKVECKEYVLDMNGNKSGPTITKYDSKERPTKISFDDEVDSFVFRYTYGKNGYITKKKKTEDGEESYLTFKYKWNGKKPKSIKAGVGKYVEAESKYNKKGFYAGILYTQSPDRWTKTVTYKCKNGLVSVIDAKVTFGNNVYYEKYKITYTKTKIPADRYRKMINSVSNYTVEGYNNEFWY